MSKPKSTTSPSLIKREIVFAEGGNGHGRFDDVIKPTDTYHDGLVQMAKAPLTITKVAGTSRTYECLNLKQGVKYTIRVIRQRNTFKAALEDEESFVIYTGHARYGRGPYFGPFDDEKIPGEHWEDGTTPEEGTFRMGFPFVSPTVEDIVKKKYTAALVRDAVVIDTEKDLDPVESGPLTKSTASALDSALPKFVKDKTAATTQLWWARKHKKKTDHVVLKAGWQHTSTKPHDLGATSMNCIGFAHLGCSSLPHHAKILRKLKGYKKELAKDRGYAFFTDAPAQNIGAIYFVYHILSMNKPAPKWADVLTYARENTNVWLAMPYELEPGKTVKEFPGFKIV